MTLEGKAYVSGEGIKETKKRGKKSHVVRVGLGRSIGAGSTAATSSARRGTRVSTRGRREKEMDLETNDFNDFNSRHFSRRRRFNWGAGIALFSSNEEPSHGL